ncbi:Aminopeptidase Y OS=Tsukamurella paurometabola (strain ATCC 8368 / DSM / CCUG 35730 / CIP 100753/ JCM 10117 / KCTC 9821 / NBRC 16120 / NCIMB 702349 / NCTC 13040) OX=521096 GN=Tpau_2343 PE=4 SV=1 [Tsukamurella paurometabola]|uniref:Aminopeptidase Y n=2 Tax=Tsukamurella paurometabola TaxID=2061 RepID=D5UQI0_TSUPD|nr:Aminopeptidase Y [Tsukamurella paurometabola DSM 20162]SUP33596.1 Aminopeptidase S [Tsukamurella paurometabola]
MCVFAGRIMAQLYLMAAMVQRLNISTSVRMVSLIAVAGVGLAACGSSTDQATPSSSSAGAPSSASETPKRPAPPGGADDPAATAKARSLSDAAQLDGAVAHLRAFQDIANRNGGNRALGSPGYQQSVEYIENALRAAGYDTKRQTFQASSWTVSKQEASLGDAPLKVSALSGSGATDGDLTAKVVATGNQGCADADVSKVTPGSVAVVQRGNCTFGEKYKKVFAKGAAALIVINNQDGDFKGGTLGLDDGAGIPVVGVSKVDAAGLVDGAQVQLTVDAKTVKADTWNVIAETKKGNADAVQMVGAHLDSVTDGPGINDNGTGSAAVLETAVKLGADADVKNKVRFAFWGAEEEGLLGSEKYVADLPESERTKIARYLNFDMLGSPNGVLFAYDGDGSSKLEGSTVGPDGSGVIEQVFQRYFQGKNVPVSSSAFDGRSDYGPFIAQGIPSGGVDTGADGKKTPEEAQKWGGDAGVTYDPNYHSAKDTIDNVNMDIYRSAVGAVAWATGYFAAL